MPYAEAFRRLVYIISVYLSASLLLAICEVAQARAGNPDRAGSFISSTLGKVGGFYWSPDEESNLD